MQYPKQSPNYVKNLFKNKNLEYIAIWDIFISNF